VTSTEDQVPEETPLDRVAEFFHRLVDLLPWRQESDRNDAHATVLDDVIPLIGRNAVPAGMQEEPTSENPENPPAPSGFPENTGS
jgi:hypothetical protein